MTAAASSVAPSLPAVAAPVARRLDIQILRGIAVLAVVFYHFRVPGFTGGYLGVDAFFVISGFLMMGILASEEGLGGWAIPRFYLRRARRLLPAALVTIAVTSILGLFVMAQWDWESYAGQAAGALSFSANIFVWQDGHDYFDTAAATKPLLHFWSLSLEEQFYLILPLALLIAGRRWRLPMLAVAGLISLVACWIIAPRHPEAAFYLLPTRAWELLMGAVLAGVLIKRPGFRVGWPVQAIGVLVVIALCMAPLDDVHPRLDALLVCLGTAVVLAGADRGHLAGLPGRLVGRVGDISYSLYLIHWPVLALATIAFFGAVPASVRVGLMVVVFVLAALQYRFVETPFRRMRGGWRRQVLFMGGVSAAAVAIAAGLVLQIYIRPDSEWRDLRRSNVGLAPACVVTTTETFVPLPECRTAVDPATALWGDSYMMQWAMALRDLPGGIVQITRPACAPAVGLVAAPGGPDWIRRCLVFHQSAFDYIMASPGITTVVISGNFRTFTNTERLLADRSIIASSWEEAARIAYGNFIRTLEAAGKRVVIIAPAASTGRNFGACLERLATGLVNFGRTDCDFPIADYFANDSELIALIEAIRAETGVPVVWPAAMSCDTVRCTTTIDGQPLYHDNAHLSVVGAPLLAARLDLADIVAGTARCTPDPADAATCAVEWPEWLADTGPR